MDKTPIDIFQPAWHARMCRFKELIDEYRADGAENAVEERGISEDDIRAVLEHAESEGKKLCVEGEEHYPARKRIGNFSAYVEYSLNGDSVEVL